METQIYSDSDSDSDSGTQGCTAAVWFLSRSVPDPSSQGNRWNKLSSRVELRTQLYVLITFMYLAQLSLLLCGFEDLIFARLSIAKIIRAS